MVSTMMKRCLLLVFLAVVVVTSQMVPEHLQKEVENLNELMEDNKLKADDDPLLQKKITELNEAIMDMQKKMEAAKAEKARKAAAKRKEEEDEQESKIKAQQQQQELDKQKKMEEAALAAKEEARKAALKKKEEEDEQKARVQAQQQQQVALDKQKKLEEAAVKEEARKAALKKQEEDNEQKMKEKAQAAANVPKQVPKSMEEQEQYRRDVELLVKLMVPVTAWDIWFYTNVFPYLPMTFRSPSSSGINSFLMLVLLCICLWFVRESRRHSLSLENEIKAMEFQQQVTQNASSTTDKTLQDQLKVSKTLIQNMKQEKLALDVKILALTSEKDSLKEQLQKAVSSASTESTAMTADEKQMLLDELHKTAEQIEQLNFSLTEAKTLEKSQTDSLATLQQKLEKLEVQSILDKRELSRVTELLEEASKNVRPGTVDCLQDHSGIGVAATLSSSSSSSSSSSASASPSKGVLATIVIPGDPSAVDRALQQAQEQYEQQRQALTIRITELELQISTEKQQQESTIIDLQTKLVENATATAAAKSGLIFAQQQLDAIRAEKNEKEDAIEICTKQMTALKTQIQQLEKDNKELKVDLQVQVDRFCKAEASQQQLEDLEIVQSAQIAELLVQITKYEEETRNMKNDIVQRNLPSTTVPPCSECVGYQDNITKLTQKLQDVSEKYESARDGGKLAAQEAATESEHYQYEISELKRHVIEITQKRIEEEDQMTAVLRQLKAVKEEAMMMEERIEELQLALTRLRVEREGLQAQLTAVEKEKEVLEKNAILHSTNNNNNNHGNNENQAALTADLRDRSDDRLMVLAQEFRAYKEASERIMSDLKSQLQNQIQPSPSTIKSSTLSSSTNHGGIKTQGDDLIDHFSANDDTSRSVLPPSPTKAVIGENSTEPLRSSSHDSIGSPRTRFIIPAAVDDLRMPPQNDGIDDERTTI